MDQSTSKNSKTSNLVTVADLVAKRHKIWDEKHDIDYDAKYGEACANKILSSELLRAEVLDRPYLLIEVCFVIVDKKRKTVPFFLNEVQKKFIKIYEQYGTDKPYFILKGRQQGFTSLITAMQLCYAIVRRNFAGFTMADRGDNTRAIFNDKCRMVYERLPAILHPTERFANINEYYFDKLNSSWRVATATDQVGRSRTLNFVHFSEVAFYECSLADLQASIGEAITSDAFVVYETTANGFNQAKDLWDSGACRDLFFAWWDTPEYRCTDYEYIDSADSWLQARIKVLEERGCDREQIAWYCKKYSSYLDKTLIRQEYPITPEEAFVSSGECIFDREAINNQIARLQGTDRTIIRGYWEYDRRATPVFNSSNEQVDATYTIENMHFRQTRDGYITIYEQPQSKKDSFGNPIEYYPYCIGGDTAGTGQDYFTAKVINVITHQTVASLRVQKIDDDLYAEQLYCLGKYYNDALIAVEINYSREPVRVLQHKYNYPNMYMRQQLDAMKDKTDMEIGFETTTKTKPIIIAELVALMREDPTIECDVETLKEMTVFVKKENGRTEAALGSHDDMVMCTAIAHFASKQVTPITKKEHIDNFELIKKNFHDVEEINKWQSEDNEIISWEDF